VSIEEPLWDMYNEYSCNQIKLKFKNTRKIISLLLIIVYGYQKLMKNGLIK